jgi:hypothetical protein
MSFRGQRWTTAEAPSQVAIELRVTSCSSFVMRLTHRPAFALSCTDLSTASSARSYPSSLSIHLRPAKYCAKPAAHRFVPSPFDSIPSRPHLPARNLRDLSNGILLRSGNKRLHLPLEGLRRHNSTVPQLRELVRASDPILGLVYILFRACYPAGWETSRHCVLYLSV